MEKKPEGFEDCLSNYDVQLFDSYCGKPIGWGFRIIRIMGEEKFRSLGQFGNLVCNYPDWYLITKTLWKEEAEELYGPITNIELGPRGGFKSMTFGETRFAVQISGSEDLILEAKRKIRK